MRLSAWACYRFSRNPFQTPGLEIQQVSSSHTPTELWRACWTVNGSPFCSEGIIEEAGNYFYLPESAVHLRAFLEMLGTLDWEPLQVLADWKALPAALPVLRPLSTASAARFVPPPARDEQGVNLAVSPSRTRYPPSFPFFSPYSTLITRVRPSARKGTMPVARRIHLQFFLCALELLTNKLAGHLSIRINSDARVICTKAQQQYAVQSSLQTVLLGVSRSSENRGTRQVQWNVLVAPLLPSMTRWRNWDCLLVVSTRFTGRERKFFFVSKQNEMVTKERSNAFECSESRAQKNRPAEEVSSDQRTRTLKRGGRRVLLPSIAGTVSNAERSWW